MKKLLLVACISLLAWCTLQNKPQEVSMLSWKSFIWQPTTMTFAISTSWFDANNRIYPRYTCQGKDFSPNIQVENIPSQTVSFALLVHDPDAVTQEGPRVHWIMWNIPVMAEIPEKTVPEWAVEGKNSWGNNTYWWPCPPRWEHRYIFTLYALDTLMAIPEESIKADLEEAMKGHILAKAEMIWMYQKQ